MSVLPIRSRSRRARVLLLPAAALLAVPAALALTATPASAHAVLVSTSPANGATLSAPPTTVAFTFDEAIQTAGNAITASVAGAPVTLPAAVTAGAVLSVAWPPDAPAGMATVSYRAVSDDGHVVTGSIMFTVTGGTSPSPTGASVGPGPTASPSDSSSSGGSVLPWVILGVVLLLAIAVGVLLSRNRKADLHAMDDAPTAVDPAEDSGPDGTA